MITQQWNISLMCNIGIINFTTDWIWARIRCIMSSNECVPQKELLLNPMEEVLTTNLVHVPCFLHTDWVLDTLTLISILEIRREIQYLRAPMFYSLFMSIKWFISNIDHIFYSYCIFTWVGLYYYDNHINNNFFSELCCCTVRSTIPALSSRLHEQ